MPVDMSRGTAATGVLTASCKSRTVWTRTVTSSGTVMMRRPWRVSTISSRARPATPVCPGGCLRSTFDAPHNGDCSGSRTAFTVETEEMVAPPNRRAFLVLTTTALAHRESARAERGPTSPCSPVCGGIEGRRPSRTIPGLRPGSGIDSITILDQMFDLLVDTCHSLRSNGPAGVCGSGLPVGVLQEDRASRCGFHGARSVGSARAAEPAGTAALLASGTVAGPAGSTARRRKCMPPPFPDAQSAPKGERGHHGRQADVTYSYRERPAA